MSIKLKQGILIAIEGVDGTGKTTQAKKLYRKLNQLGYKTVFFHEPTNSYFGKKIKESATIGRLEANTELRYFIEDRKENVEKNIKPALDKKKIVILDRYYFSTIAYQGAKGIDPNIIKKMNEEFAPKPDLTIILDMDPMIGLSRIKEKRKTKPDRFEEHQYLIKVRNIFLEIEDSSIRKIDANRKLDEIFKKILSIALIIIKEKEVKNI